MKDLEHMTAIELVEILGRNRMKINIDHSFGTPVWQVFIASPMGHYREDEQAVLGHSLLKDGLRPAIEKALKHPRCFQPPAGRADS